jgi:hypothetical protein
MAYSAAAVPVKASRVGRALTALHRPSAARRQASGGDGDDDADDGRRCDAARWGPRVMTGYVEAARWTVGRTLAARDADAVAVTSIRR